MHKLVPLILLSLLMASPAEAQQRVLGIDVSRWQGTMLPTTWSDLHNVNNRDFAFIRSSRGGTTGEDHRQGGYPSNDNTFFNLSQRYDDPNFMQNITRATSAGMLAGPYHYSRPDIIASTQNSGGIANTGTDEADHFIAMAGAWMRPGYLQPVFDLEDGELERTDDELAQFSIDFSDRIHEVMGIRPAIYVNGNYANFVLGGASAALQDQVVAAFPTLWSARWPNQSDPDSIDVQNEHPGTSISWVYGPWDDPPNPTHPWSFWQYASTARLSGFNNGNSNIDVNVAQGGMEFLKDHLVPAIWTTGSNGQWSTLTNWNSGQAPIAPVQGPGQLPRSGFLTLPSVRLPGSDDTVVLDRPTGSVTVTLATGTHDIRKLEVRETLNITGGSLTINYVPSADSTPISAQFSGPVTLSGGSLSVHTLQVDAAQTFSLGGGTLTFDTIHLMPHATTPAEIGMIGDVSFSPLNDAAASIVNGAGGGSSGLIDLGGANRAWQVSDGAAAVDLSVNVPIVNGALTKDGAGTLALGGANSYTGDTTVLDGTLSIDSSFLADAADLFLSTGATLDLNFGGGPDVVDSLFFDGVSQTAGTWGAVGSGAQFTSPLLTGTGLLQVSTLVAPIPGDFDGDGDVDNADLSKWQTDYAANAGSDADGDGDSDGNDFLIWQQNFTGPGPLATSQAVPEPGGLALFASGLSLLILCRVRI